VLRKTKPLAFRNIAGEEVIIHLEDGKVFLMNNTGGAAWAEVDGEKTVREIAVQIEETFEIDRATALADCLELFNEMQNKDLLTVCE